MDTFQAPECMWGTCDVTTFLIGQMLHIALRCLEGSTLSNLVHRRRRCARIVSYMILCLEGSTPEDGCLSLFIALRWMQEPCGVMMWLAENIQACLRIFRQAQHQWLVRDILHRAQGVFYCLCLMAQIEVQWVQEVQEVQIRSIRLIRGRKEGTILWRTALQAEASH